jgi:hypothetical protein
MPKKRTSLESLFSNQQDFVETRIVTSTKNTTKTKATEKKKKQLAVYLPVAVYEQLRRLAFEERAKMHDYLMEGLDLVFKNRGLKSLQQLSNDETKQ